MIPLERDFDLTAAQSEIKRVMLSLGFTYELTISGKRIFAARCRVYDANSKLVASGLGKGDEQSAVVGAMFEAIEHFATDFRFLKASDIEYLPSSYFASKNDRLLSDLTSLVICQNQPGSLPCILHASLSQDEKGKYCPVGLFLPKYVDEMCENSLANPLDTYLYTRLGEYSSNTGVAIGMNRTESIIHGLLEAVERDSLSRFICDSFFGNKEEVLQKLEIDSLPDHLQALAENVACECAVPNVSIYSMPNRFGIPAYCSWINKPVLGMYQGGFGCSLSEAHAVARSLYEVAQGHLCFTEIHSATVVEELHRKKVKNLQIFPALLRCAEFDLARIERLRGCGIVKYKIIENYSEAKLEDYLRRIVSKIQRGNSGAYTVDFSLPVDTNIMVTHSIISNADRFNTVLGGRTPMPSSIYHEGV